MTTNGAIKFFRTGSRLARLLNVRGTSIYSWGKYPPELRQRQIAELSNGALKIEEELRLTPIVEDYS